LSAVLKKKIGRIPQGLARVRKELPPPVKILRNRKKDNRKNWKEKLRQELQESLQRNVS
jgi:hypothetical protein